MRTGSVRVEMISVSTCINSETMKILLKRMNIVNVYMALEINDRQTMSSEINYSCCLSFIDSITPGQISRKY